MINLNDPAQPEIHKLNSLFHRVTGEDPQKIDSLALSGSNRLYFRLQSAGISFVGTFNENLSENRAFISFSETFSGLGLPVPEIVAQSACGKYYLQSDLGDETLFSFLIRKRESGVQFPLEALDIYKQVLSFLPEFQIEADRLIDYQLCYPRASFDRQSILWDLNYFKYHYLKLAGIPFHEQELEEDFNTLSQHLLSENQLFFLYRDFQSRNIMIINDKPFFIDYQGGRRGALAYDVASLLYDAKADIPEEIRSELLEHYLDQLNRKLPGYRMAFLKIFPAFVLIRILQAMGAYGFRGFFERKTHFLQSVPYAVANLERLIGRWPDVAEGKELPELRKVLETIILSKSWSDHEHGVQKGTSQVFFNRETGSSDSDENPKCLVTILSFSYKNGIPPDPYGHGGGFIFDCRALPNPGRYEAYKNLTGRDEPVIRYLEDETDVKFFLTHVTALVQQSAETYSGRGFGHLQVAFGCTGGQHRSVYCAEQLAKQLIEADQLKIEIRHLNLP